MRLLLARAAGVGSRLRRSGTISAAHQKRETLDDLLPAHSMKMPPDSNSEPQSLDGVIAERLPVLDDLLAQRGVELKERPLRASLEFVELWVPKLRDDSGREFEPPPVDELVTEKWFSALYQSIERWYLNRYRGGFDSEASRTLTGFVTIWSTAFELAVPRAVSEADIPGETAWLRIPNSVLESEQPLDWLCQPPSLDELSRTERKQVESEVREVATRLRSIEVSRMGIPASDDTVEGLLAAISSHLHAAGRKAITGGHPALETGCWDLYFAGECALKALLSLMGGSFPKIHPLSELYERARRYLIGFPAELLEKLPTAEEAISYRYGRGRQLTVPAYWAMYRATLEIVDRVLDPLPILRLGEGQIKIARPPWMKPLS